MAGSEAYVTLKGGLSLPLEPVLLVLELESRGFSLTQEDGVLFVQPSDQLTASDFPRIRRWKPHIIALIGYEPSEVQ